MAPDWIIIVCGDDLWLFETNILVKLIYVWILSLNTVAVIHTRRANEIEVWLKNNEIAGVFVPWSNPEVFNK